MILTVTLNTALDVTYDVDELVPARSHRVRRVTERAGGKGVNVASVLARLGFPVTATGLLAGAVGERVAADLDRRGIDHAFFGCAGESRRTVTVVGGEPAQATVFNEPGPLVTQAEWSGFLDGLPQLIDRTGSSVVVLSGSLPPGVPTDAYGQLVTVVRACGGRSVLDTSGKALRLAVAAGPDLAKPNAAELIETMGPGDLVASAQALRSAGARNVCVSSGADGLVTLTDDGSVWRARLRSRLAGNPTGAGDALAAALAVGLARGQDWATSMHDAVAWSAAAVLQPVAGEVDPDDVARLRQDVHVDGARA